MFMMEFVSLLFILASLKCCYGLAVFWGDHGFECDQRPDNSTTAGFKTNLNSLLSTLVKKGPENRGFYMAAAGIAPDRLYGLVQCRGDVSAQDCASCLQESLEWALTRCNNSNDASIWLNWCFMRYSDSNFLGQVNSSMQVLTIKNTSREDNPVAAARGQNLMSLLAVDVPNQPFLFKTGYVDIAKNEGKRYGLVQCNRDLSKSSCNNCTEELLEFYFWPVSNRTSYLVYSYSCRMWSDNYKFYFNYTLPRVAPNDIPIPTDSSMQLRLTFCAAITVMLSLLVSSSAL